MPKKILIVDDEKNITLTIEELFASKGYEVFSAFTGKGAIKYLEQNAPDLILLDMHIGDISGIDILRRVKAEYPVVKTVILTGFLDEYKKRIEAIGCDVLLAKPFSLKMLIKVVDSTLSEKKDIKESFSRLVENPKVLAKARLLFVEPNEIMFSSKLAYFQDVSLCKGDYELCAAFSEKEVLEKLQGFKPDILLSDIGMFRLFKLSDRIKGLSNPPKDVVLYGIPVAKELDKDKDVSFVGGLFDPVTLAVTPDEMAKLGNVVRSTAIAHGLYIESRFGVIKDVKREKDILISHSFSFLVIFSVCFFVFMVVVFYIQARVSQILGAGEWVKFITILLIAFSAKPLESALVKLTDGFLFQRRYAIQKILIEASRGLVLVTDNEKILNLVVHIVKKYIRARSVGIFQYDEDEGGFILKYRRGESASSIGFKIPKDSPLVVLLNETREAVLYRDMESRTIDRGIDKLGNSFKSAFRKDAEMLDLEVCVPSFWKNELIGFLVLGRKLSGDSYTKEETRLLSMLSNEVSIAIENAKNFRRLAELKEKEKESYFQTVLALARSLDEKDHYTRGHLDAVTKYGIEVARELCDAMGIKIDLDELKISLLLHDIGKIGIPDALLHKNGTLDSDEWTIMRQHPDIGERIVGPIEKLKNVARIIKHHQERYDGTGYPDGLKGEEIPIQARIISVVDAYHAMISDRPYRRALTDDVALNELRNNSGTQFDPDVIDAFFRAWEKGRIKRVGKG